MSHLHAHREPPYKCVEIDDHVCLQPLRGGGEGISKRNAAGELEAVPEYFAGFIVAHDRDDFPHRCEGVVHVEGGRVGDDGPTWTMTGTLEGGDLTLSPSVLCMAPDLGESNVGACGFHGFVRDGKWVPA